MRIRNLKRQGDHTFNKTRGIGLSYREIGLIMGKSDEWVRQIELQALRKLRFRLNELLAQSSFPQQSTIIGLGR